uniref:NADH-ubiquinone oxidoreductase chain 4L n=1 Tax=Alitta succinea TaxID=981110 RepID=A0A7G8JTI6_ALISU|nr:NADH dehydrogenase subunit 4L [Alitta succinea]QNJ33884.1 NADH dehydrogenase subunit 4L [Alitta succinea]QNJ33897.1 NADH dehydrogenase subunit 4L [Alitta succinea]
MASWMTVISPMLVLMALTCVIMQRNHLLMTLLALEAMILGLIMMLTMMTNLSWLMFVIVILTFGACEASLGLACMTAMSRSYGNDHINSLNMNKC